MGSVTLKLDTNTEEGCSVVVAHLNTPVVGTLNIASVSHVKVFIFIVMFFLIPGDSNKSV